VRYREHQLLLYLELGMIAFCVASIFGTYGALSFTYLSLAVAWLAATILEKEPWYSKPEPIGQADPVPAVSRSPGYRSVQRRGL